MILVSFRIDPRNTNIVRVGNLGKEKVFFKKKCLLKTFSQFRLEEIKFTKERIVVEEYLLICNAVNL